MMHYNISNKSKRSQKRYFKNRVGSFPLKKKYVAYGDKAPKNTVHAVYAVARLTTLRWPSIMGAAH